MLAQLLHKTWSPQSSKVFLVKSLRVSGGSQDFWPCRLGVLGCSFSCMIGIWLGVSQSPETRATRPRVAHGAPAQALQAVVGAVRNARAEYGVELGRRIPARLLVAQPELRAALAAELAVLCSLAKLEPAQVRKGLWFQGFLGFRVVGGTLNPPKA